MMIEKEGGSPLSDAIIFLQDILDTDPIYKSDLIKTCTLIRLKLHEITMLKEASPQKEPNEEGVDFYKTYFEDPSQIAEKMLKETCEIMKSNLPSRILDLGGIPNLNGLTFINGDIGVHARFLSNKTEKALVELVIVLLHELIHKVRFIYSADGNYLKRTSEKCEDETFGKEAGLYLTKKLFGITFEHETHFESIDEEMVKLILNPDMWVKNQLYQVGEYIKHKTPPTLNTMVSSIQHKNYFKCYHQLRNPMISSFDLLLSLPVKSL